MDLGDVLTGVGPRAGPEREHDRHGRPQARDLEQASSGQHEVRAAGVVSHTRREAR